MKLSNEIKHKPWDSKFFGYKVGEINIDQIEGKKTFEDLFVDIHHSGYELVYLLGENIPEELKFKLKINAGFHEKKVLLEKEIQGFSAGSDLPGFKKFSRLHKPLNKKLLSLTYQSGTFSRFNLDLKFKENEFQRMYKAWIEDSLAGVQVDEVFVIEAENRDTVGFITIKLESTFSSIGLVAVDENARGRNIGSSLLRLVEDFSFSNSRRIIQVTTQGVNKKAIGFYLKNKYKVRKEIDIYHLRPNSSLKFL